MSTVARVSMRRQVDERTAVPTKLLATWMACCVLVASAMLFRWAEAHIKIARMTLTIKLDGNWSSFQLANSAPPLSVTDSAIAPSARMPLYPRCRGQVICRKTQRRVGKRAVGTWRRCFHEPLLGISF